MAVFQPGPIVGNIRGSIGGTTFSKSAGGATARVRRGPLQITSNSRGIRRNQFSALAKQWSAFTPADQLAWISFAAANPVPNRFGEMQILNGMAMWVYLNGLPKTFGFLGAAAPPSDLDVSPIEVLTITATADPGGTIIVEATNGGATTDDNFICFISGPTGRGRTTPTTGFYMLPTMLAFNVPVNVTAAWKARFGNLPQDVGNRVICQGLTLRETNGARSPLVRAYTRFA